MLTYTSQDAAKGTTRRGHDRPKGVCCLFLCMKHDTVPVLWATSGYSFFINDMHGIEDWDTGIDCFPCLKGVCILCSSLKSLAWAKGCNCYYILLDMPLPMSNQREIHIERPRSKINLLISRFLSLSLHFLWPLS